MIALVTMLVMGVLVSAVVTYAATSASTVNDYRQQRAERYAGDGAMKAAINWVASKQEVGLDPNFPDAQPACQTNQTVTVAGQSEPVKVSCKADAGGESGRSTDLGLLPPEALVLLSDRASASGPYNVPKCSGAWDTTGKGLYNANNTTYKNDDKGMQPERGAWFRRRVNPATTCSGTQYTMYNRAQGTFTVRGDVAAKSNVRVDDSVFQVIPWNGQATKLYANGGCTINVVNSTQCSAMANRGTITGPLSYASNSSHASDPARLQPNSPAVTPVGKIGTTTVGDIAEPFLPVGFGLDGRPTGSMPVRTQAYDFNADTKALAPLAACSGSTDTVVFLPGWYQSAEVLNKYTANPACKGATFWFAPEVGDDDRLLTSDDKTGAFYLDFRTGASSSCGTTVADSATRWCIGGAADQSSRVVVGTPRGWTPQGHGAPATEPAKFPAAKSSSDKAAQPDCDETRPGGQLIFGGESHVFVQDGSLEVCAGPNPNDPASHQAIGIWAAPSVAEVGPSGASYASNGTPKPSPNQGDTNDTNYVCARVGNQCPSASGNVAANVAAIDGNYVEFGWGSNCFICNNLTAWVTVPMSSYTPPDGYRIQKITARAASYAKLDSCSGILQFALFCSSSGDQPSRLETPACGRVEFPKVDANVLTQQNGVQILQVADLTEKVVLYDASTGKNCIGVAAGGASLPAGTIDWNGHAWGRSCGIISGCGGFIVSDGLDERLDGITYQVTLAPAVGETGPMLLPQSGCIVVHPNYNDGAEQPDCALIKAVSSRANDAVAEVPATDAVGRVSIKGTVYAPSSAIELDDSDVAYPIVTRGAILRHLRVSGYSFRTGYSGVAIDRLDGKTTAPREVVFTACIDRPPIDPDTACSSDDKVLTRSRVRFDPPTGTAPSVATVLWWSGDR